MSQPLYQQQTLRHRLAVAVDDLFGIALSTPYNITISTWAGLIRDGLVSMPSPVKKWLWVKLANGLDRLTGSPHCSQVARNADMQRCQDALHLIMYGEGK